MLPERLHAEDSPGWRRESNFETAHVRNHPLEEETVVGAQEKAVGAETEVGNQGAEECDVYKVGMLGHKVLLSLCMLWLHLRY